MNEGAIIAFAQPGAEIAAVAIAGAGTLLAIDGSTSAAPAAALSGAGPSWKLADGGVVELALEALADPVLLPSGTQIWLCRAVGTVGSRELDALATITSRSQPGELSLERSISVPFSPSLAFVLSARLRSGAQGHGSEQLEAVQFCGEPPVAAPIDRPRLSTTYDAEGIPRHAGIELWPSEDAEFPLRIGAEALSNGEIHHPDGTRSRVLLMAFHHDGHRCVGSYTLSARP